MESSPGRLALLILPGVLLLPLVGLLTILMERAVPLSRASEEAKSVGRGLVLMLVVFGAMAVSGVAAGAWYLGLFVYFIGVELALVFGLCFPLVRYLHGQRWQLED